MSKAEQKVVYVLSHGGQIWTVALGDLDEDPNTKAILAVFDSGEFVGTQPVQLRILWSMRHKGIIDFEGEDWNTTRLVDRG